MKGLKMTWAGLSRLAGEPCAVINYRSFANPFESATPAMEIVGRSLYWGTMWISLEDKQVEKVNLNEDLLMEMTFTGATTSSIMNMQREVVFEKVPD
jgi:hypothetical protein